MWGTSYMFQSRAISGIRGVLAVVSNHIERFWPWSNSSFYNYPICNSTPPIRQNMLGLCLIGIELSLKLHWGSSSRLSPASQKLIPKVLRYHLHLQETYFWSCSMSQSWLYRRIPRPSVVRRCRSLATKVLLLISNVLISGAQSELAKISSSWRNCFPQCKSSPGICNHAIVLHLPSMNHRHTTQTQFTSPRYGY